MNKRFVDLADGAKLVTYRQGQGTKVLLVSGLGGTAAFWSDVVSQQSGSWDMISFDQRGIGQSTRGTAEVSIAQLADDCLAVLDAHAIDRCVMIGHSTGGVITQDLAARHPDRFDALVLSGSWLSPHFYLQALFQQRMHLLATDPESYQALGVMMGYAPDWLCAHWPVYEKAMTQTPRTDEARAIVAERIKALLSFDGRDAAPSLTMPVLVLGAQDDAIVPLPLQQILADALPHARLAIIETGGHFFPITRVQDTVTLLTAFIGQQDG